MTAASIGSATGRLQLLLYLYYTGLLLVHLGLLLRTCEATRKFSTFSTLCRIFPNSRLDVMVKLECLQSSWFCRKPSSEQVNGCTASTFKLHHA